MTVFVFEALCHETPADLTGSAGVSLLTEGRTMLDAVVQDLSRCGRATAVKQVEPLHEDLEANFRRAASVSDWSLIIAPETGGWLEARARWVVESGGRLLGPNLDVIRLTGDKFQLAELWKAAGVPTPPTILADGPVHGPAVVKPRNGAGSQETFFIPAGQIFTPTVPSIVQPFVPGTAASVSFLTGPNRVIALPPVTQHLTDDGRFHYLGGSLPMPPDLAARATAVARTALAAIPFPLTGWIGVDVILGECDVAIEINPRLTTSYVGLRQLCRDNLAERMLAVAAGEAVVEPTWHSGTVEFRADGTFVSRR